MLLSWARGKRKNKEKRMSVKKEPQEVNSEKLSETESEEEYFEIENKEN